MHDRLTAADFDLGLLDLFDQYVHGDIDRRTFLARAEAFAGGVLTPAMLLARLNPAFADAQQVRPDDARIKGETVAYRSPHGSANTSGYLVKPANASARLPGVLVVHENRGLNPHIEDIARRVALENFLAFAPDALAPLGGYPGDEDKARELFSTLDQGKTREDFVAAAEWLTRRHDCTGTIGAVGFCYGGGIVNMLATRLPDLAAGVPFYGSQPPAADVPNIKAPLLIHYAEHDDRINAGWPSFETALKANHIAYQAFIYPGTQHGFNNDTTPRYDVDAANLAWSRTMNFFDTHLR
ncbi:MAG: dienelactone hydrolase family protein [Vicinamibacterales bacterium]